ncbi:MAG TPA: flagellar export chaperone FliS [Acidobacteriaceae bacterium]|nr:flagellar export chaperone FliS [Acidobacteriaceae bacterium]
MNYQQQTLAVMNSLDLVVALYDGMIRFLHRAIANIEAGDIAGRRDAIRRVLDILTYLQARLRTDVGGQPAAALSEFYAAIYAQCVRGSRDASVPLLQQSIRNVQQVRDAWKQVSSPNGQVNLTTRTPEGAHPSSSLSQTTGSSSDNAGVPAFLFAEADSHRWSA